MHLPSSSARDRYFYAQFYSRHPSEIVIIDKVTSPSVSRTLSESPTTLTPLSEVSSSAASGFFSSSDCSSSESTSSFTKRRRPTAPTIQERLNTYESACTRPTLPTSSVQSKQKALSPASLVSQIITHPLPAGPIKPLLLSTSNSVDNATAKLINTAEDNSSCSSNSRVNETSYSFDSAKRYLSKSTSQLCDQSPTDVKEDPVPSSSSRNILEVIQEELSEIRRADHDLKKMFLSIYGKIQNIQQLKSSTIQQQKGHRHHYHQNERSSRSIVHCCYSSNSDIRRMSCNHHHNRKHALHTVAALRNRTKNVRKSSTADNDSYVDTDSSSSSSDSGTCSSPVDNGPCVDD